MGKSIVLLISIILMLFQFSVFADEIDQELENSKQSEKNESWMNKIQEKHQYTTEQMEELKNSGLTRPQMAVVAAMAQNSNKSLGEILQMRQTQKMGWGQIAKELGVEPKTIGQSVASLRANINKNTEMKQVKAQNKLKRREAKAERKSKRAQIKAERKAERQKNKN